MPPHSDINKSATCFLILFAFHFASLDLIAKSFLLEKGRVREWKNIAEKSFLPLFFICFGNKCLCVFRFYAVPDTRDYITRKHISDQRNSKGIFSDFLLNLVRKLFAYPLAGKWRNVPQEVNVTATFFVQKVLTRIFRSFSFPIHFEGQNRMSFNKNRVFIPLEIFNDVFFSFFSATLRAFPS